MGIPNFNASTGKDYIYRPGTAPNTRAAVSQKNKVYGYAYGTSGGFQQIGVVSEFGHDESRSIEPIRGVGYGDQVAELVPGVTEPMTLTLNKTLLYTVNLFQILGYKGGVNGLVRSLKHHRWPFDLGQELVFSEIVFDTDKDGITGGTISATVQGEGDVGKEARALRTIFEGCWLNSYSASYTSDAAIVAENGSVTVTDIIDGASTYGEWIDTGLNGRSLRFGGGTSQAAGD